MAGRHPDEVTPTALEAHPGGQRSVNEVFPDVYDELCRVASRFLRSERPDHTLQTGGLVHEAYLRLINQESSLGGNRAQFFAVAARMMRRILLDHARRHRSLKRGGGAVRLSADNVPGFSGKSAPDLLQLDEALKQLAEVDAELANIVELKFFGGLTHEEIGEVLGCAAVTVKRRWRVARARLYQALRAEPTGEA